MFVSAIDEDGKRVEQLFSSATEITRRSKQSASPGATPTTKNNSPMSHKQKRQQKRQAVQPQTKSENLTREKKNDDQKITARGPVAQGYQHKSGPTTVALPRYQDKDDTQLPIWEDLPNRESEFFRILGIPNPKFRARGPRRDSKSEFSFDSGTKSPYSPWFSEPLSKKRFEVTINQWTPESEWMSELETTKRDYYGSTVDYYIVRN